MFMYRQCDGDKTRTDDGGTRVEGARRPITKLQRDRAAGEVVPREGGGLAGCERVASAHGNHEGVGSSSRLSGYEGRKRRERGEDV